MKDPVDVHKVFAEYFKGCEALAYALSSRLAEGNICIDIKDYASNTELSAENPFFSNRDGFLKQTEEGYYVTHTTDGSVLKPIVIMNGNAYLQRYFKYETEIIKNIRRLGDKFHIVTGGPGSGKTYSVAKRLNDLFRQNPNLKAALAAPTGKAAFRMYESIKNYALKPENHINENIKPLLKGLKAETIHRLLGYRPDSVFFKYDEKNRLPYDVVIIDECSMVDGALMSKLLSAIGDNTILYLIGDRDQLASVEAGSVFGDLCRAAGSDLLKGRVEIISGSRRFKQDEGIWRISQKIIKAEPFSDIDFKADEQVSIDYYYSDELFLENALIYAEYISEENIGTALKKLNRVRFLCVTKENDRSVAEYNKKIRNALRNNTEGFNPKSEGFYHNQPIMITKNDYKLNLFNGDIGIIREKEVNGRNVFMAFFEAPDNQIREIQAGYLNHWKEVFAMTIHKSQGSEFDNVVVVLPEKQGKKLLTRELLYTGVTRATGKVLIQSNQEIISECIGKGVIRASGLESRIIENKN